MSNMITQALTSLRGIVSSGPSPSNGVSSISSAAIKNRKTLAEYACLVTCNDLGINVAAQLPPEFQWGSSASYDTPLRDAVTNALSIVPMSGALTGLARAAGMSLITQTLTARVWEGSASAPISLPLVFQAYTDEVNEVLRPVVQLQALTVPHIAGGTSGSLMASPGPYLDLVGAATSTADAAGSSVGSLIKGVKEIGGVKVAENAANKTFRNLAGRTLGSLRPADDTSLMGKAMNSIVSGVSTGADAVLSGVQSMASGLDNVVRGNIKNRISIRIGNYMFFENVVVTDVQQTHHVMPIGTSYGRSNGNMQRIDVTLTFEPFFDLTLNDLSTIFLDSRVRAVVQDIINKHQGASK